MTLCLVASAGNLPNRHSLFPERTQCCLGWQCAPRTTCLSFLSKRLEFCWGFGGRFFFCKPVRVARGIPPPGREARGSGVKGESRQHNQCETPFQNNKNKRFCSSDIGWYQLLSIFFFLTGWRLEARYNSMSLQKKAQEDRTSEKVGTPIRLWDFSSAWPRHLKTSLFCIVLFSWQALSHAQRCGSCKSTCTVSESLCFFSPQSGVASLCRSFLKTYIFNLVLFVSCIWVFCHSV